MDEQTEFNPRRRLCPDGTCTGIIGPDGRCGECGRVAGAAADAPADLWSVANGDLMADDDHDVDQGATVTAGAATSSGEAQLTGDLGAEANATASAGFDPRRRLCDDGSCLGVIGPGGVCGVCGRRAVP